MSRIDGYRPRRADVVRRVIYRSAKRLYGGSLEPTRVTAHHKPLLLGYSALAFSHDRFSRAAPMRLKKLAMLRTAQLTGCEWCLDFGSRLAADAGVPVQDLRELSLWRSSGRFDDVDRLVLEYAEAMTRTPVEVSDELVAALRERFDARALVELTMSIALENQYSRFNWALGIESEGFSEGTYCVRPEADRTLAETLETVPRAR
jgi:AhpD family alkylhydroperoxidase